jgi:hypothetical protein
LINFVVCLFKTSFTLAATPLGHHRTRPIDMTVMEPREVHQRNQRPSIYLHRWRRTVEEGVRETPLNLKGTYNWLWKSKRSCRLPLLALPLNHNNIQNPSRPRRSSMTSFRPDRPHVYSWPPSSDVTSHFPMW